MIDLSPEVLTVLMFAGLLIGLFWGTLWPSSSAALLSSSDISAGGRRFSTSS